MAKSKEEVGDIVTLSGMVDAALARLAQQNSEEHTEVMEEIKSLGQDIGDLACRMRNVESDVAVLKERQRGADSNVDEVRAQHDKLIERHEDLTDRVNRLALGNAGLSTLLSLLGIAIEGFMKGRAP